MRPIAAGAGVLRPNRVLIRVEDPLDVVRDPANGVKMIPAHGLDRDGSSVHLNVTDLPTVDCKHRSAAQLAFAHSATANEVHFPMICEESPLDLALDMRTVALIDGASMYVAAKMAEYSIDWGALRETLEESRFIRPYYFNLLPDPADENTIVRLLDYLEFNGYSMVWKNAGSGSTDDFGRTHRNTNTSALIAAEMLRLLSRPNHGIEQVALFATNPDLLPMILVLKDLGIRVVGYGMLLPPGTSAQPGTSMAGIMSGDMRRALDAFVPLDNPIVRRNIAQTPKDGASESKSAAARPRVAAAATGTGSSQPEIPERRRTGAGSRSVPQ